jgi:hypothetical protein
MAERWTLRWAVGEELDSPKRSAEVEIPDHWYRVLSGVIKPGDLYLDFTAFKEGKLIWRPAEKTGEPHWECACLIREGMAVDKRCERCAEKAALPGERFCAGCRQVLLKEIRKDER